MAKTKTVVRYRNRRVKPVRHKKQFTIPVAVIAGLYPTGWFAYTGYKTGGVNQAAVNTMAAWTGFGLGTWSFNWLKMGLLPAIGGILAHRFIGGRLGVNRALARAGVPLVRV